MADSLQKCSLYLLRYAPDAIKGESVNIGLALVSEDGGFAQIRFTQDWRRVKCLDPAADTDYLEAIEAEVRSRLEEGGADRDRILHVLRNSFSNAVEVAPVKACLTVSPDQEIGNLAELYLKTHRRVGVRENAGRGAIVAQMRDEFERAGVWQMMRKKITAADYTYKGDPLKIDCGYLAQTGATTALVRGHELAGYQRSHGWSEGGTIRMFHAVPLAADVDVAKVLAFSYPQLREGMARAGNKNTELTAIVEDDLVREDESVAFALNTLERSSILVATTAQLSYLAARAKAELRV
jgi:hypothetical protein